MKLFSAYLSYVTKFFPSKPKVWSGSSKSLPQTFKSAQILSDKPGTSFVVFMENVQICGWTQVEFDQKKNIFYLFRSFFGSILVNLVLQP